MRLFSLVGIRIDPWKLIVLIVLDSDNLTALMSAIHLTRNIQGVDQKQLFTSAVQ